MSGPKKYGLVLPDKNKTLPVFQATRNVFGCDSESDEDTDKKSISLQSSESQIKQVQKVQAKAILEDPTVYQYDEIYDSMTKEIECKKNKGKVENKPRYIENLIKTADKRKIENERRIERQVQKERENEGNEFADKEVFVTSAYKKKLEELRLEEEKEKYEEYLESIGDVTKQKDLGGFYRHLYELKLGNNKEEMSIKKEHEVTEDKDTDKVSSKETHKDTSSKLQLNKQRNYRKRKSSHALSDGEIEDSEEEINRCNLEDIKTSKKSKQNNENIDADSDFSIDESSDEGIDKENIDAENAVKTDEPSTPSEKVVDLNPIQTKPPEPIKPKVKIDIWKKRCVGELFDQALKRYYERKVARGY